MYNFNRELMNELSTHTSHIIEMFQGTDWVSDTSVRCKVGEGVMGSRRAVVTAGVRSGSLTEGWSTDAAGVSVMEDVNRGAAGAVSVTVHGANMGKTGYTAEGREGGTGCEVMYTYMLYTIGFTILIS